MKKILIAMTAILMITGTAFAAEVSTTLPVTALVGVNCTASTTPMSFAGYDGLANVQSTADISVACPVGIPYNIAFDAGLSFTGAWRAVDDGLGNQLEYALIDPILGNELGDSDYNNTYGYGPSIAGLGSGATDVVTIDGQLFAIGGPAIPGVYNDTVTVTVYY